VVASWRKQAISGMGFRSARPANGQILVSRPSGRRASRGIAGGLNRDAAEEELDLFQSATEHQSRAVAWSKTGTQLLLLGIIANLSA
jgi:hypothetical protein